MRLVAHSCKPFSRVFCFYWHGLSQGKNVGYYEDEIVILREKICQSVLVALGFPPDFADTFEKGDNGLREVCPVTNFLCSLPPVISVVSAFPGAAR